MELDVMFPKPAKRVHDLDYMMEVKQLPCVLEAEDGARCSRSEAREANHTGPRGLSRKADDDTTIPMCTAHHLDWTVHSGNGYFAGWTAEERRAWAEARVEETRAVVLPRLARRRAAREDVPY